MLALLFLCFLMFLGCYLAGCIPLTFSTSPRKLRLITVFGAGLLVAAALAIIIPEGVNTLNSSHPHAHDEHSSQVALHESHLHAEDQAQKSQDDKSNPIEHQATTKTSKPDGVHNLIGVALTLGFVFMFLVDQMGSSNFRSYKFPCLSCCRSGDLEKSATAIELDEAARAEHSAFTTTLGLVVHSIADGIAIGAAFGLTFDLTLILFVAIMLHKAPAAFGFVSFLVNEGVQRHRVKRYLFVFALASPLGAIGTYLILVLHGHFSMATNVSVSSLSIASPPSTLSTGFALLLSGGTFLYVAAAHVLPQLASESAPSSPVSSTLHTKSSSHCHQQNFTPLETAAFVVGSCIPVLISFGHSH